METAARAYRHVLRCTPHVPQVLHPARLTERVHELVLPKSIPARIRQLILYNHYHEEEIDKFVRELTFERGLYKHFL